MGFKKIIKKELETSLNSAFIGSPLRIIEEKIDISKRFTETQKTSVLDKNNGVIIQNEENLDYFFDPHKELKEFNAYGSLVVINNSEKDRIWDARLEFSNVDNTDLEINSQIKLGHFEPKTNKKLTYNILKTSNLLDSVQLTERIEVLNINIEDLKQLNLEECSIELPTEENQIEKVIPEQFSKADGMIVLDLDSIKNELVKNGDNKNPSIVENLDIEANNQILSMEEKITEEQKSLNTLANKSDGLATVIKKSKEEILQLENELKNLIESKKNSQSKASLDAIGTDDKELDQEALIKEYTNQIEAKKKEIDAKEKQFLVDKATNEEDINKEYNPKIKEIETNLKENEKNLTEAEQEDEVWSQKKKEYTQISKGFTKDKKNVEKEKAKALKKAAKEGLDNKAVENIFNPKIEEIDSKLKENESKLVEAVKNSEEWASKNRNLKLPIKTLKKDYDSLVKEKYESLHAKNKQLLEEKELKIIEIRKEIELKEENLNKTSSVLRGFDLRIEKTENQISEKHQQIQTASKELEMLSIERDKQNRIINDLKKELQTLNKEKEFKNNLPESEETKVDEVHDELKKRALEKRELLMSREFKDSTDFDKEVNEQYSSKTISETSSVKTNIIDNRLILFEKSNSIRNTVLIKNTSKRIMEKVVFSKHFSKDFFDFKYQSKSFSNLEINNGQLLGSLNSLQPGEEAELVIFTTLLPKNKKMIGTGAIQLSYTTKNESFSGVMINNFSGFSHAMHAMKIKEKETVPNNWTCSLIFKNNSESDMELKSILVLDTQKKNKFVDHNFESGKDKKIVQSGNFFETDKWNLYSESEPKFFRKLEYSVIHTLEISSRVNLHFEESTFNIADIEVSKRFSKNELKSFEETSLENYINVKNTGTVPIKGILIKEEIPSDFIPTIKENDFKIRFSSGRTDFNEIKVKISPLDQNPIRTHNLELMINLNGSDESLIDVNEFIELSYPFKAIAPDYKKKYSFPLDIDVFYPTHQGFLNNGDKSYFKVSNNLNQKLLPSFKIIHNRRDLQIGKEIFPGRTIDEFAINITIRNKSNIALKDFQIKDTISSAFELVSSSTDYNVDNSIDGEGESIQFTIENIQPFQEKEIRYYLKNKSGESIDYEELESYIFS